MKRFIFFLLLLAATCSAQNPLTVFHGGTGRSTLTVNSLLYGNGTSPVSLLPIGSNGQVLGVSGGLLTWTTPAPAITDYVATDPATAHRNLITPTANSVIPLELKGKSGSSANLFDVQTSGANDVFYIQSGGFVNIHNTLIFNANSGATQLGLDNGSAITFGLAGDIPTSGGSGGLLAWKHPTDVISSLNFGFFGDGSNGSGHFDGIATVFAIAPIGGNTYTLQNDIYAIDITVDAAITVFTNGWRIFCTGTLTNNGNILNDGNDAIGTVGGSVTHYASLGQGTTGANGRTTTGNGAAGVNTTGGSADGGAGGGDAAGHTGGLFGAAGQPYAIQMGARTVANALIGGSFFGPAVASAYQGGAGGGAGALAANDAGGSGAGGGGGGVIGLYCNIIVNNSVIRAKGGIGGNAGALLQKAGGGGGGGGGLILVVCNSYSGNNPNVAAGAAGTQANGGFNGNPGSAGAYFILHIVQ